MAAKDESKRVSELYARVSGRTQALASGVLSVDAARGAAVAQLVWSATDLVNSATSSFHVQHHITGLESGQPAVHRGVLPVSWDAALTSVSPSKRSVVALKQDAGKAGEDPEGVFSVYSDGRLVSTFKAPKTLHGAIYLGEREGGIAWSHDETRIAYVAEKIKSPTEKSAPFWENVNSADKTAKKAEEGAADNEAATVLPGNKFLYEDEWGERYVGRKTGALFVATLATGKIEQITGIPESVTCADVTFTPGDKGVVFTCTKTDQPRRLGILYCYNRCSELYEVEFPEEVTGEADAKKKFTAVKVSLEPATDADERSIGSVRCLRFSPDGKQLAFLGTRKIVTHGTCSFLGIVDWATKRTSTIVPIKDEPDEGYSSADKIETAFNGIFTGSLARNAWSGNGKYVFFDSQVGSRVVWKYVDVSTRAIVSPKYVDGARVAIETVLDRHDNAAGESFYALVSVSSPTRAPSVYLVSVDAASGKYVRSPIAIDVQDDDGPSPYIKDWQVYSIPTSVSDSQPQRLPVLEFPGQDLLKDLLIPQVTSTAPFEATLLLPNSEPPSSGYPVVLELHGGPHGNAPVMYRSMCDFFAVLGFAVVTVNYRGSTGYGRVALESLVGRVGTQDVFDCHYALQHVLTMHPTLLDASRVHCSGGSHGGFLVQHLISQFPGYYKSTVTRNPVANIASMFYSTDIPDWALAAAGVQRFESIVSLAAPASPSPLAPQTRLAILNKLWQHSPVANDLSKVTTPVLYGLGGKDRRVPPTQGLEFRATLQHHGVETKLLWYPDDSHPLGSVAASSDFAVNWGLWLLEHNPHD